MSRRSRVSILMPGGFQNNYDDGTGRLQKAVEESTKALEYAVGKEVDGCLSDLANSLATNAIGESTRSALERLETSSLPKGGKMLISGRDTGPACSTCTHPQERHENGNKCRDCTCTRFEYQRVNVKERNK